MCGGVRDQQKKEGRGGNVVYCNTVLYYCTAILYCRAAQWNSICNSISSKKWGCILVVVVDCTGIELNYLSSFTSTSDRVMVMVKRVNGPCAAGRAVSGRVAQRGRSLRLSVSAKVNLDGGPRVIRGKCYVTRDVRRCCCIACCCCC